MFSSYQALLCVTFLLSWPSHHLLIAAAWPFRGALKRYMDPYKSIRMKMCPGRCVVSPDHRLHYLLSLCVFACSSLLEQKEDLRKRLSYTTHKLELLQGEFDSTRQYLETELRRAQEELDKFTDKLRRWDEKIPSNPCKQHMDHWHFYTVKKGQKQTVYKGSEGCFWSHTQYHFWPAGLLLS